jgi:hypothetical protein
MDTMEEAAAAHAAVHAATGRQSTLLRTGWVRGRDDCGDRASIHALTGEACACTANAWVGNVLVCRTCFADGT